MAIVGAIRWDAWYPPGDPPVNVARSLSAPGYQYRAPFFSSVDQGVVSFQPTASTMSAEIAYAKAAKLNYWAFLLYSSTSAITNGYNLFQANPNKNNINWCQIRPISLWGTTGNFATQVADAVSMCRQTNYQKILTNRPLVYIFGGASDVAASFGTDANFKTALDSFRASCVSAGLGTPYLVVMAGSAALGAARVTAWGADAVSGYNTPIPSAVPGTFSTLTAAATQFWDDIRTAGNKVVPLAQLGWDRRPRIVSPVNWEATTQRPYFGLQGYFTEGTTAQIAAHVKAAADYTVTFAANCDGPVLIYAWNEFDEGGWLCPTLGDPNANRCLALGALL